MKTRTRKLTLCALLGASTSAYAAFTPFPDGGFDSGQGTWGVAGPASFSYPSSGGNPGGYGIMDAAPGWGVWVNNNNDGSFIPLATLGMVAGNGYTFKMDMKVEAGTELGKLKLEWQGGGDTGAMPAVKINDGWNTYTWDVIIPAGKTGMKVVPVNENGASIGFDNIGFESVPYYVAPPPPAEPTDLTFSEPFDDVSTEAKWTLPSPPGTITATRTWNNSSGNPAGSTDLVVNNPGGEPAGVAFTYTATGVDFGTGPVKITFDGKALGPFPGTALHVRYNGNFVGAIQGSFNESTFTPYTQTFDLNQGFDGTDTFTLQFEFAMGAVPGAAGSIEIDNIQILTNLPESQPFAASIAQGTAVSWIPTVVSNSYQPQRSLDDVTYTNLGDAFTGTSVNTAFDSDPAPFYRVLESVPGVTDIVFNGSFEDFFINPIEADGWPRFQSQPPVRTDVDARTGSYCMQIAIANAASEPNGSEIQQNTRNAFFEGTGDAAPGSVTPGNTYGVSFWIKQISTGISYEQKYTVAFLNSEGGVIGGGGVSNVVFSAPVDGQWHEVTSTGMVAPAGAESAFIQILGVTGAVEFDSGQVLVDDVTLTAPGFGSPTELAASSAPGVKISWPSVTGTNYQVESSTDLSGWSNFGGVIAGDDSVQSVVDVVGVSKFYKVGALP